MSDDCAGFQSLSALVFPTMNRSLFAVLMSVACSALAVPTQGPIRILCLDGKGEAQRRAGALHQAMQDLGRDAIWLDYALSMPKAEYDLVLSEAELSASGEALREQLLAKLPPQRVAAWREFLAAREPEKRRPHPQVANYEKRPQPVTFQEPLSVKGSMERTQVPADCELKLFAAEPDIAKPIAFAWDERGRCWVVETRDYPHALTEAGRGGDSIKICEDSDGDGRADKFTVFADGLNMATGIVFANGGVVVAAPPKFWLLKDSDGDDRADVRQVIFDGWGVRDTHAQASNLHYGFDNWLYGCVGYSGFDGKVNDQARQFAMGTYRFRPDGASLEFLHQFSNNSWGHSTNAAGDQFGGTANNAPLFFGGIAQTGYAPGKRGSTAQRINVVDRAHPITGNFRQVDVFGGYTAAAGSNFIVSDQLPKRFAGMAMVCEPTMKLVALFDVRSKGAGWEALDYMNLYASSDEWNSPVHAEVGPDGAVWVADFQNFIIQHNPTPSKERGGFVAVTGVGGAHENELRDHSRGRIYRIVAKGSNPKPAKPALDAGNLTARLTAQRLMVEGTLPADVVTLKSQAVSNLHALWVLRGLAKLDDETHRQALLSPDPVLRRNAIRALGSGDTAQGLFFGSGVVADPDPHTRLAALNKLAEFHTTAQIQTLVRKLSSDPLNAQDEWLKEAVRMLGQRHNALNYREGPNLLPNPGFETLAKQDRKMPEGWTVRHYGKRPGNAGAQWGIVIDPKMVHSGKHAMRVITRDDADTSSFADVPLKPNTDYLIKAWIKTHAFRGKASLNDHIGRAETSSLKRDGDWTEVEVIFNSRDKPKASINLLHVGKGDTYYDDVKLCELIPADEPDEASLVGDAKRGEDIFWNHPVAACKTCHMLAGKGSAVGPALDGIASRKDQSYLIESLMQPNAKLAEGYTATPISPMPPMGLVLKPQELADVKAFLFGLK